MWLTEGVGRSGSQRMGLTMTSPAAALGAAHVVRVRGRSSELWIPSNRCAEVLRRCTSGQDSRRVKGDEEIGRQNILPATDLR